MWLLSALPGLLWTPFTLCSRLLACHTKTSAAHRTASGLYNIFSRVMATVIMPCAFQCWWLNVH